VNEDEVDAAVEMLLRDLAPGPFRLVAGWGHAISPERKRAIVTVARAVRRLRNENERLVFQMLEDAEKEE